MSTQVLSVSEGEIDRLCELTNVGAGHAATAFAQLAGRPVLMSVPRLQADVANQGWETGVFFELEGAFSGLVALLFRDPMRESLMKCLLGVAPHSPLEVESALMEVGNILVSRVASAIADTLGDRILPSVPTLVMSGAGQRLEALACGRGTGDEPIRIECDLGDNDGEIGGMLVLFPDLSDKR